MCGDFYPDNFAMNKSFSNFTYNLETDGIVLHTKRRN